MDQSIPPPNIRTLLPPLLACLPTAFASSRPPPALLTLLSPMLQQRVELLSSTAPTNESWLPLLCWDGTKALRLSGLVESDAFELHPVSGEVEFRDPKPTTYRQLDEETLQAKVILDDLGLQIVLLWVVEDRKGEHSEWKVAEVKPTASHEVGISWYPTISEASKAVPRTASVENVQGGGTLGKGAGNIGPTATALNTVDENDDDDAYWGQYDNTPGRTPAQDRSPAPPTKGGTNGHRRTTSEDEYFAQYAQVQPEMDNDDPRGDRVPAQQSSLDGNVIEQALVQNSDSQSAAGEILKLQREHQGPRDLLTSLSPSGLLHPRPSSRSSDRSSPLERLEEGAEVQSRFEVAIRQHVKTSITSLHRLARTAGIQGEEFNELVRTELEILAVMESDGE